MTLNIGIGVSDTFAPNELLASKHENDNMSNLAAEPLDGFFDGKNN